MEEGRSKDVVIPLILLGIGLTVFVISGFAFAGPEGAVATLIPLLIGTLIAVVLGIAALYLTASIMKISFGSLGIAVLKLCAIFVFAGAVAAFIPIGILALVVAFVLYVGLLWWLFELEPLEAVVCALVIIGVRIVVGFILLTAIMSMV